MKTKSFVKSRLPALVASFTVCVTASSAWATSYTSENGFETDAGGWTSTTRVVTNTDGVPSAEGGFHGKVSSGSSTRWGGYKSVFPAGGYTTSVRVYLNPGGGWANDTRFSFTSAINKTNGEHLRDFGFNAAFYDDITGPGAGSNRILVNVSNGVGRGNSNPKDAQVMITTAGWYTFEHVFQDDGSGVLAVALTVRDSSNSVVGTPTTLSSPSDLIGTVVGGNRYGWFHTNEFSGGLPVDCSSFASSAFPSIANITQNIYHLAISSAVAEADPDDVIQLSAGDFNEGALSINKALKIQGPNAGTSGFATRGSEARLSNMPLTITAAGVVLDGIEMFQTNNAASPVSVQASNTTVRNSIVRRAGVDAGQSVRGIEISPGLTGYSIEGNLLTGSLAGGLFGGHKTWNSGIYVNGGTGSIIGNTFENCRTAANLDDFNAGLIVTGNTFRTCGTYLSFGGVTPTNGQFTITGNAFGYDYDLAPTSNATLFNNSNVAAAFRIDATGNTFGGIATTDFTNTQKFALEARMFHRGRSGRNGVVDFVASEQIVVAGTTIASAIAAASPGDVVRVGPGTYSEDVSVNKALTLAGVNAGTAGSAVGRIAETVLSSSRCLVSADNVVIDGFKFTGTPTGSAAIDGVNQNASHVGVRNNLFENVANTGIYINGLGTREDWTITRNRFQGIGQTSGTLGTGNNSAMNLWFSNGITVTDNVIDTVDYNGLNLDTVVGATVSGNTFSNVGKSGLQVANACAGPILIEGNTFDGCNKRYDLDQNYWYGAVKLYSSTLTGNITIRNNELRNSVVGFLMARILGPTTNLVFEDNILTGNSLGGFLQYWGAGQPVGLTNNYWGSSTGPAIGTFNNGPATPIKQITGGGDGDAILTALDGGTIVSFSPWYVDAGRTVLRDGIISNLVITTPQTFTNLYVAPGTTVTVTPTGSLGANNFELADGAEIVVNGGELDFGDGSVISGTFTIFNSFGSWDINGDTTFTVNQSLALVSDIHVAAGKTVTVNGGGELILDGCVMDSQTTGSKYNFTAATDGLLTLARCVVSDANINIDTTLSGNLKSRVFDNSFATSDIEASAAAMVYHNLFDGATDINANTDVTTAFDAIDGWANVTQAGSLQNKFTLDFEAPIAIGRTLDAGGNLFVQPTDPVVIKMEVTALGGNTITAAEALLGYNSGMLTLTGTPTRVTPLGDWEVIAETAPTPSGLGIVDSALGLQLDAGEEGISAPSQIAKVNFTAGNPGLTLGFFRVQTDGLFNPDGTRIKDTRLTRSTAGLPSLLEAFTANTGELVIDDQAPAIAGASVDGSQVQANSPNPVDVLDPTLPGPASANQVFRNGNPVRLTFTATDAGLAGLDAPDATADLALTVGNGTTTLGTADYTVTAVEAAGVVTYTVTLNIPVAATNGTYAVTATVRDRSGNVSPPAALGSFQIDNEVLATVELQDYVGGTREVVFTATNNAGTVLTGWTKNVVFSGPVGSPQLGSVTLEQVPAGTTAISAKAAWNLRSKLQAVFSPVGVSTVSLTGTDKLPGGDFNGDNVVNTLDYSMLRYHWMTASPVADINGNAVVNVADYTVLKGNFYTIGDPQ